MFTEAEVQQIWELLKLDISELAPYSYFRQRLARLESFDAQYSTSVVTQVKSILATLSTLDTQYPPTEASNIVKEEIKDEYAVEYGDGGKMAGVEQYRKTLIGRLLQLIDPELALSGQFGYGRLYPS